MQTKKEIEKNDRILFKFGHKLAVSFSPIQDLSDRPVESFVPGQAYDLAELVRRFENGQRLNVPASFNPMHEFEGPDETFDQAPPEDIVDVVDVQREYERHQQSKANLKRNYQKQQQAKEKLIKEGDEDAIKKDEEPK